MDCSGLLRVTLRCFVLLCAALRCYVWPDRSHFRPSWDPFGAILGCLGPSWDPPGAILKPSWALLAPSWPSWGPLGALLWLSWTSKRPSGSHLGPSWPKGRKWPQKGLQNLAEINRFLGSLLNHFQAPLLNQFFTKLWTPCKSIFGSFLAKNCPHKWTTFTRPS